MEKVKFYDDKVVVRFNDNFYSKASVEVALMHYQDLCEGSIGPEGVTLIPKDKAILSVLPYEFYNYVLALTKNG